jgi:purine-binding chemotaxis protein CheW
VSASAGQFCTFVVDGQLFGVSVSRVQEVLRFQAMTHVPLAPADVRGLINLRGDIVTAIDMRRRLGRPALAADLEPMNVVVNVDGSAVSLLVDEIGDVIEPSDESLEEPPDTIEPALRRLLRSVYKLEDRLLLVLDAERTVDLSVEDGRAPLAAEA